MNKIIFSIIIASTFLTACVSKKKYLEMESSKLRAESRVRELTDESNSLSKRIETMISDFENMKNELMESNAIKSQMIDSLTGKNNVLLSDVNEKDESLRAKLHAFRYEKQQLNDELEKKKIELIDKQMEVEGLTDELNSMKSKIEAGEFDLKREKEERQRVEQKLNLSQEKFAEINTSSQKLKEEIATLKKQIQERDESIERLQNNVKLLKKELN